MARAILLVWSAVSGVSFSLVSFPFNLMDGGKPAVRNRSDPLACTMAPSILCTTDWYCSFSCCSMSSPPNKRAPKRPFILHEVGSGRLRIPQLDMQLPQLLFVHGAGGLREQVLGALRLREGDHVAQALGAGHQHHEAVQPDGDAAVRRRAVLQRVQQETELELRFLRADLQRAEHLALHVLAVDTDRAASEFDAV